jgi:hypothetical protein
MTNNTGVNRAYVANIALVIDATCAAAAFERLSAMLEQAEPVLDFRLLQVVKLGADQNARISDGTYADGGFFVDDGVATDKRTVEVGARVVWNDPDRGLSTGVYSVVGAPPPNDEEGMDDVIVALVNDAGGNADALLSEIET